MRRILIVEDEVAIADTLLFALASEGFDARRVALAGEALDLLRQDAIDLVILDVGLPDMTGFEACKQLRRFSAVPVMFLTARAEEIDRVVGLEIGADDYVVKPFSPREVVARVRAILKRSTGAMATPPAGEFLVDVERLQIHYRGRLLKTHRAGIPAAATTAGDTGTRAQPGAAARCAGYHRGRGLRAQHRYPHQVGARQVA